jgi:putative membrane protein
LRALATTLPSRRRVNVALFVGVIAGIISGFVKLGWEVLFPPRVPSRTPEPTVLLHQLGISANSTYTFSSVHIAWATLVIHFGFSIALALLYVVIAEYNPKIKLWMGAAFGVAVWIGAHLIVMPILGLTPGTFHLPFDENLSEFFGHIVWLVSIEIVRRDLRSRITHEPDAEVPLPAHAPEAPPTNGAVAANGAAAPVPALASPPVRLS